MMLYEAARSFIGVPWLDSGRSDKGMDCFSMIVLSMRKIGINADPNDRLSRKTPYSDLYKGFMQYADLVKPQVAAHRVHKGIRKIKEHEEHEEPQVRVQRQRDNSPAGYFYTLADIQVNDVLTNVDSLHYSHTGIVSPGRSPGTFNAIYVPFKKAVTEVPLDLRVVNIKWLFRLKPQLLVGN